MKLCCNDEWYLENLKDIVRGKDSGELLQGKIIVEFNELLAFKSSVENIKSFVTLTADEYRGSYERETEKRRRTCVFVGTTNTSQFLVDKTGNRRFLPMDCGVVSPTKSLFADDEILSYEFKQAWAEAYQIYKSGKFSLTMPRDLEDYIESLQEDYKEDDPLVGVIQNWLNSHDDDYTCNIQIAEKALGICEKPDKRTINQIAEIMNNSVSGRKELHTDLLNMVSKDVTSGNVVKTDFVTWNKMKLLKNHCHSLNSLPMLLIVTVIVTAESAYL